MIKLDELYLMIREKNYLLEKSLLLLPSIAYGYKDIYKELSERINELGRRSLVLLAEASLFLNDMETFSRLKELFHFWFRKDPKEILELYAFMVNYQARKTDSDTTDIINKALSLVKNLIIKRRIREREANLFFELFFRYASLFGTELDTVLLSIMNLYEEAFSPYSFYQVLTAYLRHSAFIPPPKTTVMRIYDDIYPKISLEDPFLIPLISSLVLALNSIGREDLSNKLIEELLNKWIVHRDPSSLFNYSRSILGRCGLLFALTTKKSLDRFLSEANSTLRDLYDLIKYVNEFYLAVSSGEKYSINDIEEFSEYAKNILEESVGEREIMEDPLLYLESVISNVTEAIDSLINNVYSSMLITHSFSKYRELIEFLKRICDDTPEIEIGFQLRLKNSIAMLSAPIDKNNSLKEFQKSGESITKICRKDKECMAWLSNDLGVKLGYALALTEDNSFMKLAHYILTNKYVNRKQFIRGFASSLYGVISITKFGKKYRDLIQ